MPARGNFEHSIQVGLSFGLTSGVITTLGLITGLAAGTSSRLAVVGGIVTIAVADALSDALGIHISEEAENVHTPSEVWMSTAVTFASKLGVSATFLVPVLMLDLATAVIASSIWGGALVASLSVWIARRQGNRALPVVAEHLSVMVLVIVATNLLGRWVAATFG